MPEVSKDRPPPPSSEQPYEAHHAERSIPSHGLHSYEEGEEDGGWFSWLGGSDSDDPLIGQEFQVQLTTEDTSQVTIHILGSDGQPIGQLEQQGLLTLLQGNIT